MLFAGLEQGVWVSLDRGATLVAAAPRHAAGVGARPAHSAACRRARRGDTRARFWILDDITPLERLSAASDAGKPALFPPQRAVLWWTWWIQQYGVDQDECCAPAGQFAGDNPDYGALISYYLPQKLARAPVLQIVDARGRVVWSAGGPRDAGLNRIAWGLSESAPTPWHSAREWNKGPKSGPAVVPGAYTVRLTAGGRALAQRLDVAPIRARAWTQGEYLARRDFLRTLDAKLSAIDVVAQRARRAAQPRTAEERAHLASMTALFTASPVNSEDDLLRPDGLRERVQTLIGAVALSQGPPLAPHYREAREIDAQYAEAFAKSPRRAVYVEAVRQRGLVSTLAKRPLNAV